MSSAIKYQSVSIKGILQVLDWSKNKEILTIGVVDGYNDEYTIVMDGSGKPLIDHLWETVSIQGLIHPDQPYQVYILSYQIHGREDYLNGSNRLI